MFKVIKSDDSKNHFSVYPFKIFDKIGDQTVDVTNDL